MTFMSWFKAFAEITGCFTMEKSIVSSAKEFYIRFNIFLRVIDVNEK